VIGIVVSRADEASEHVAEHLLDLAEWREATDDSLPDGEGGGTVYRTDGFELREFDDLHLRLDGVADAFGEQPEFVVFASRHSGETGALLTAHFTGNFGPAEYGGRDGSLARACPGAQQRVLAALAEHAPDGYEVGTECTHHGPSEVSAPSMFVELGSGESEWRDPAGARAVARAILDLRGASADAPLAADAARTSRADPSARCRTLVWFGGTHYASRPYRVVRETEWAVGHVAADWCLDAMGNPAGARDVIEQAFEESDAAHAVVTVDDPDLEATIADLGYRVVSETWVRQVDGVPLDLVADIEAALSPVDDGLRFGEPARGYDGGWEAVSLPSELVAAAAGLDREAVFDAASETALAFETAEGGTLVSGRAAFAGEPDAFVECLLDVLRGNYDEVVREDDAVVVRESTFDPGKAASLGVPEGPAFGRLADGETVTVNGREIPPEVVRSERTERLPILLD
jgi:D-aminoacyl-tRNA deacylase